MRKIKFRGQRSDTKEWVYGFYYKGHRDDKAIENVPLGQHRLYDTIITPDGIMFDVLGNTVGQYSNFNDKKNKEMYEGDIIKIYGSIAKDDPAYSYYEPTYQFVFEGGSFDLVGFEGRIRSEHVVFSIQQYVYSLHLLEVIGNIYDKPETIKNANS